MHGAQLEIGICRTSKCKPWRGSTTNGA